MSPYLLHILGAIVGLTLGAFVLTQLGPILFFKIPFSRKLAEKGVLGEADRVIRAYRAAAAVFIVIGAAATATLVFFQPRALYGFVAGLVVVVIFRARSWGYTVANLQEFMEAHKGSLKDELPGDGEGQGSSSGDA